jgi:hypothetical protein
MMQITMGLVRSLETNHTVGEAQGIVGEVAVATDEQLANFSRC